MNEQTFPPDFVFGAATAAYQIEGAWNIDGKGPSVWDAFSHTKGKIKNGETGDTACGHYYRFREDVALMRTLRLDAYRFSISWPRILPDGRGAVNQKGLDFYKMLLDALLEAHITPYVTLFHWDYPLALQQKGLGFDTRDSVGYFADYAAVVVKALSDRVKHWITLNEPLVYASLGHLLGVHAPGLKSPKAFTAVVYHELLAHGEAVRAIRAADGEAQVGITLNLMPVYPLKNTKKDNLAVESVDQAINRLFLDPIFKGAFPEPLWKRLSLFHPQMKADDMDIMKTPIDFLGINNYTRAFAEHRFYIPILRARFIDSQPTEREFEKDGIQYTSMGWEVYPRGLYELLMRVKEEFGNIPMYVTENGAAFDDRLEGETVHDLKRIEYIGSYLKNVSEALHEGANVKGYFVWSLMDNFEWAFGFSKRFGLVYVDFPTEKRIIKDSGHYYADLIKTRKL